MEFHSASPLTLFCFVLLLVAVFVRLLTLNFTAASQLREPALRSTLRAGAFLIAWLALLSLFVQSGWLEQSPEPRLMIFFALIISVSVAAGFGSVGSRFAFGLPVYALVSFQSFRLALEFILHAWVAEGVIPSTMSWSGSNYDVVSGFLALAMAPLTIKRPALAWIPNLVGFALLLNVMRVAVFSSPLSFAWDVQPKLQLAFHLPYAWILPLCVGTALFGHVVLTRALLRQS